MRTLVTGAGGFIAGHLVKHLLSQGDQVLAVDIKPRGEWFQPFSDARKWELDLRNTLDAVVAAEWQPDRIYNLAASMGGMGYIESHKAECMLNVLINTNLLRAMRGNPKMRYFFASSACVYAADKQSASPWKLKESDAYPASPENGYGWEKLFSERMCQNFMDDFGMDVRVARLHNVYGPHGTWKGGREKAPAAICRKVIDAKLTGNHEIEIWGDGSQVRSFMWIGDCVKGMLAIMNPHIGPHCPVNLGSSESVTIDRLVDIVEEIAGIKLKRTYNHLSPRGVIGRSSDNTLFRNLYGWEPSTLLRAGMEQLYEWIYGQMI